jgi:predicted MFS family arabinose efflux permease
VDVAAIVLLFLTVVVGMVVLGLWADPVRTRSDRHSVVRASLHISTALGAVALCLVFAVGGTVAIGWLGVVVLVTAIVLGLSTLISSRAAEQRGAADQSPAPVSTGVLAVHGDLRPLPPR